MLAFGIVLGPRLALEPLRFKGGWKRFSLISFAVAVRVRMCCPLCFPVEAAESGCYVGTLDYTKAFDMVRPEKACILLEYHGRPAPLANALGSLWGSQGRLLFFAGVVNEGLVPAGSSLPQGVSLTTRLFQRELVKWPREVNIIWPSSAGLM